MSRAGWTWRVCASSKSSNYVDVVIQSTDRGLPHLPPASAACRRSWQRMHLPDCFALTQHAATLYGNVCASRWHDLMLSLPIGLRFDHRSFYVDVGVHIV